MATPTEGNDVFPGTPNADAINGLGGNDKIYGRSGTGADGQALANRIRAIDAE